MADPAPAFIWGDGGAQMTPAQIAALRKVAEAHMTAGMDYSPVKSWSQGAARVAQGIFGGMMAHDANAADKANAASDKDIIAGIINEMKGGANITAVAPTAAPPAASAPTPAAPSNVFAPNFAALQPPPTSMDANAKAIAGIESGGRYDLQGPVITSGSMAGQRANGKYQVMDSNVGPWSEEHFGQRLTPEQFRANPQAQDAVFNGQFGKYVKQYGSPEAASRAWFAGPGGMNNPNAHDQLGTTVANYGQRFASAAGATPAAAPASPAGVAPVAATSSGANPAVLRALTSPYASESTKKVAGIILQQQLGDKVTYQTTPDGDILAMDPHGRTPPKVVYQATPKPIAVPENSQLWDPRTRSFIGGGAPANVTLPDGTSVPIPPGIDAGQFRKEVAKNTADVVSGKKTEVQANAEQFANRMEDAEKNVQKHQEAVAGYGGAYNRAAEVMPFSSAFQSTNYQQFNQARSQFITALLRKESGAAINKDEFVRYDKEFFPQPGDSKETITQKQTARSIAMAAMKKNAGPGYKSPVVEAPKGQKTSTGVTWSIE